MNVKHTAFRRVTPCILVGTHFWKQTTLRHAPEDHSLTIIIIINIVSQSYHSTPLEPQISLNFSESNSETCCKSLPEVIFFSHWTKKSSLYSDVSLSIWSVTKSQLTLWTSLCIYFTINGAPSMLSGHVANNRLADCVILVACAFYPMKGLLLQREISAFGRIHISVCRQSSLHSTVTF